MSVVGVLETVGDVVGWPSRPQPGSELVVPVDAAHVLGRAARRPGQARRLTVGRRERGDRLQLDPVLPAVAEVVQVGPLVPGHAEHLVQSHTLLAGALVAVLVIELGDEIGLVVARANLEAMQVGVGPADRDLEHEVHLTQHQVAWQREAPPDRRFGAVQLDGERQQLNLKPTRRLQPTRGRRLPG